MHRDLPVATCNRVTPTPTNCRSTEKAEVPAGPIHMALRLHRRRGATIEIEKAIPLSLNRQGPLNRGPWPLPRTLFRSRESLSLLLLDFINIFNSFFVNSFNSCFNALNSHLQTLAPSRCQSSFQALKNSHFSIIPLAALHPDPIEPDEKSTPDQHPKPTKTKTPLRYK